VCVKNKKSGFTLVEIMVSMVISSLVIAGVYGVYTIQQRSYTVQEQVTELQQRLRSAVDFMTRDMRMAGYNPDGACDVNKETNGILTWTSDNFSFQYCENGEMNRIVYSMDGSDLVRTLTVGSAGSGVPRKIAEGVDAIEFQYLAGNRASTAADPAKHAKYEPLAATAVKEIRLVRMSVLLRSSYPDPRQTDSTQYVPASGTAWTSLNIGSGNPPNDNFHRRLLVTSIELRNVGL